MTIKTFIDIVAHILGKQNDEPTKRAIGILAQEYRQELIKQYYVKHGHIPPNSVKELKWVPIKEISELEDTEANDYFKKEYKVRRSANKIPQGVSLNKPYPFLFVGEPTREDSFEFINPEDFEYKASRRFNLGGYYTLLDGYVYVYNYTKKAINIRYVPADLVNFIAVTDINGNVCFEDFEIEEQFSNTIRRMVYEELGITRDKDLEVRTNEHKTE